MDSVDGVGSAKPPEEEVMESSRLQRFRGETDEAGDQSDDSSEALHTTHEQETDVREASNDKDDATRSQVCTLPSA